MIHIHESVVFYLVFINYYLLIMTDINFFRKVERIYRLKDELNTSLQRKGEASEVRTSKIS